MRVEMIRGNMGSKAGKLKLRGVEAFKLDSILRDGHLSDDSLKHTLTFTFPDGWLSSEAFFC